MLFHTQKLGQTNAPEFDALGANRDAVNPERMGPVNSDGVMEILENADHQREEHQGTDRAQRAI